ncbi:MAG: FaeA/PapI family transcriptional regulator [Nanoarchaeota archaeon]
MSFHNFDTRIINFAKKDRVVTTAEISKEFKISWNTAEKYLLELALERKLKRIKKEGANLWVLE